MIKNSSKQTGSTHIIVIVILALAVLGLVGFVFWQNHIKNDAPKVTDTTSETTNSQENQNADKLSYTNEVIGVSFDYPKNWVKVECDNTYIQNPKSTVYFGTNNYGVGILEGTTSNLCGGGTDFPPQMSVARVGVSDEFTATSTDVTIGGKSAKKYTAVAGQDSIQPGLETTRYAVDMGNGQNVIFGYNRFPGVSTGNRDNSDSSLQDFTNLVEKDVRFLNN